MCSTRDFYFDGVSLRAALVRCHHSVLSTTDRSLSNDKIELLNKVIKFYTNYFILL